jgi:hypothetical protein
MLFIAEVPPGQVIPGWERYEVAIIGDIPNHNDGLDTLILIDPRACEQ